MANGNFGGGDGTSGNPYLVEDAYDLNAVRNSLSAHYRQTQDIDLTGWDWQPIGATWAWSSYYSTWVWQFGYFTGTYDGDYHRISNLTIVYAGCPDNANTSSTQLYRVGLFAAIGNVYNPPHAVLQKVWLDTVSIGGWLPLHDVGALVGTAYGARSTASTPSTSDTINISNCVATSVSITGHSSCGALIGAAYRASIRWCSANGTIEGMQTTGGLVGYRDYTRLMYCIVTVLILKNPLSSAFTFGRFCGRATSTGAGVTSECYASNEIASAAATISSDGSNNRTALQMKQQSTYYLWFSSPDSVYRGEWACPLPDGSGYPVLIRFHKILDNNVHLTVTNGPLSSYGTAGNVAFTSIVDYHRVYGTDTPISLTGENTQVEIYNLFDSTYELSMTYPEYLDYHEDMVIAGLTYKTITLASAPNELSTIQDLLDAQYSIIRDFTIMNDIDMTGIDWLGVGGKAGWSPDFEGNIDGQGYAIINSQSSFIHTWYSDWGDDGPIPRIIQNITLHYDERFTSSTPNGLLLDNVGGYTDVVGCNIVRNCHVTGVLPAGAQALIKYVYNYDNNTERRGDVVIEKCSVVATVKGLRSWATLCLFSELQGAHVKDCYVDVTTVVDSIDYPTGEADIAEAAGFSGYARNALIENCYALTKIIAHDLTVLGYLFAGFITYHDSYTLIKNCYAVSTIEATAITIDAVSGFLAPPYDPLNFAVAENCYFNAETTPFTHTFSDAQGLTTAQMKQQLSYNNWDFVDTWGMEAPQALVGTEEALFTRVWLPDGAIQKMQVGLVGDTLYYVWVTRVIYDGFSSPKVYIASSNVNSPQNVSEPVMIQASGDEGGMLVYNDAKLTIDSSGLKWVWTNGVSKVWGATASIDGSGYTEKVLLSFDDPNKMYFYSRNVSILHHGTKTFISWSTLFEEGPLWDTAFRGCFVGVYDWASQTGSLSYKDIFTENNSLYVGVSLGLSEDLQKVIYWWPYSSTHVAIGDSDMDLNGFGYRTFQVELNPNEDIIGTYGSAMSIQGTALSCLIGTQSSVISDPPKDLWIATVDLAAALNIGHGQQTSFSSVSSSLGYVCRDYNFTAGAFVHHIPNVGTGIIVAISSTSGDYKIDNELYIVGDSGIYKAWSMENAYSQEMFTGASDGTRYYMAGWTYLLDPVYSDEVESCTAYLVSFLGGGPSKNYGYPYLLWKAGTALGRWVAGLTLDFISSVPKTITEGWVKLGGVWKVLGEGFTKIQ